MSSRAAKAEAASDAGETSETSWRGNRRPLLWAMVLAGAVLRLIGIGHKSFWIDEIASVAIARRPAPVFWHFLWHDEGNMAAYYVLLRPWLHVGYGEGTVRLLSVIPGIISIPLMYVLGRRLFGNRVGTLSALFLALNACAISVSQEARAYSFVVLLVLLSTYFFVRLIEEPTSGHATMYAVIAGLTCYFHYFGLLAPAAQYASLVGIPPRRGRWKLLILAAAIIVLLASPILWLIHAQDTGHISWVGPPSFLELYHLGAFLAADSGKAVGGLLLALDLVLVGCFGKRFAVVWRDDVEQRWRYLLIASSVITPIVITLLLSILRPAFYHRFLIICLPGWIMMTALGAEEICSLSWRRLAITLVCLLSIVSAWLVYRRTTEDWRSLVTYLIANSGPGDRVLYYQSVGEFAGESYRDWLQRGGQRPIAIGINAGNDEWLHEVAGERRVWLVVYRANARDAEVDHIQQELSRQNLRLKFVSFYPGVGLMEFAARE